MLAKSFTGASGTGDEAAFAANAHLVLLGWSVSEDAGAAAFIQLHDGTAATDPIIANIRLAASTSQSVGLDHPVNAANGIFISRVTGTSTVTVYASKT